MEFSDIHQVALWGFLVAVAFGAVARHARFCTVGAISDWLHFGDTARLRAWFLAIGVAILGVHVLKLTTPIDFEQSIYLTTSFGWLGHLLGGLLFGIGMTLASGCVQRSLVLAGGGNLKSLVVLLVLAVTAYVALHGPLAPVVTGVMEATSVDLARYGLIDQAIPSLAAKLLRVETITWLRGATTLAIGLAFVAFVFSSRAFRRRPDQIAAGMGIGLFIVAGWYVTGVVGRADVAPVPLESYTFVAPAADTLRYLTSYTGSTVGFGMSAVFGMIVGSFLHALATGGFRIDGFASLHDLLAHLAGAALMGFGGALALGCTIGQGITGMSTLALGSLLTLVSIIFGSILTMRVQYHLLDRRGFWRAARLALADLRLGPAPRKPKTV